MIKNSINSILLAFLISVLPMSLNGQCSHAWVAPGPGISNASQTDLRSDSIDIIKITINGDLTDFAGRVFYANTIVEFQALVSGIDAIELDLLGLQVDSVVHEGLSIPFSHDDTVITIDLPSTLNISDSTAVQVYYHGQPVQNPGDWGGFYWTNNYAYNIGVSFLEDPHNFGRVWFPCFDNFVERMKVDCNITTEDSKTAVCGGLAMGFTDHVDSTRTWHWELHDEIPSYLVSVAVSDFALLNSQYAGSQGTIPITLAARPNDTSNLKSSFVHLTNAIDAFEQGFGPFLFEKVGYSIVPFGSGAMEHATNIAYMRVAVDGTTTWEDLMAHELAHHWFGDLVTCREAGDMWLNEGWATFSELWFTEAVYGKDAYKDHVREHHDDNLRYLHVSDGDYLPVSGVPHQHTYSSTVYEKGADMAHTIRGILGDQFESCVTSYLNDFAFSDASSDDFQQHLSTCSGIDLSDFFDKWIYQEGHRHFSIDSWEGADQGNGNYQITGSIRQKLVHAPEYSNSLPIEVNVFDEQFNQRTRTVFVYGPCTDIDFEVDINPVYVTLDMEEQISDATVDFYMGMNSPQLYDYEKARASIDVHAISDSALIRVVHNFAKPDPFRSPRPGLHLSPNRYWKVEGIVPATFQSTGIFPYNGTVSSSDGYLDNDLITGTEDSLVIMFRSSTDEDWMIVDSFFVDVQINANNARGQIEVYDLQLGEYVLAYWDASKADDTSIVQTCQYTTIQESEFPSADLQVYPNPGSHEVVIDWNVEVDLSELQIANSIGQTVFTKELNSRAGKTAVLVENWSSGTYLVSILSDQNSLTSKKFIKP